MEYVVTPDMCVEYVTHISCPSCPSESIIYDKLLTLLQFGLETKKHHFLT